MTKTNEHDALIGQIVREHGEARRDLAYVQIKAKATATRLRTLADELARTKQSGTVTRTEEGLVISDPETPPRELRVPAAEEIATLIEDLHRTTERVRTLSEQRKQLGID